MAPFKFTHIFEPLFFWLRLTGLWPEEASYSFDIYAFYAGVFVLVVFFLHTFFQTMGLFAEKLDLDSLGAVLFVPPHLMMTGKVCVLLSKLPSLKRLVSVLDDSDFRPRNEIQEKICRDDFKVWRILYRTYQTALNLVIVPWCLRPLRDGSFNLPLLAWYPFDATKTPFYEIAYLFQFGGLFFAANAHVNLDSLVVGLIVYLGTQCSILCDDLRTMRTSTDLVKWIERHRKVLTFFTDFNGFLGQMILVQLCGSVATMVVVMYTLSLAVPGSIEYYILVVANFVIPLEIALYCWFGSELELRSSNIQHAIFESDWIGNSPEFQKLLLMFMARTQESMTLTALNLFPLSLRTFMAIMKSSYSYFAVLRQMQNN